jgi:hypothetical protein
MRRKLPRSKKAGDCLLYAIVSIKDFHYFSANQATGVVIGKHFPNQNSYEKYFTRGPVDIIFPNHI